MNIKTLSGLDFQAFENVPGMFVRESTPRGRWMVKINGDTLTITVYDRPALNDGDDWRGRYLAESGFDSPSEAARWWRTYADLWGIQP